MVTRDTSGQEGSRGDSDDDNTWHTGDAEQVGRAHVEALQHVSRVVGVYDGHLGDGVGRGADPDQGGELLVRRGSLRRQGLPGLKNNKTLGSFF